MHGNGKCVIHHKEDGKKFVREMERVFGRRKGLFLAAKDGDIRVIGA